MTLDDQHQSLLKEYPRPLVHMRAQVNLQRFSLILGAGVSKSFSLPDWPTLVEAIAADDAVQGQEILKRFSEKGSLPYKTELLFQQFRRREAEAAGIDKLGEPEFENQTVAKWLEMCRHYLYRDAGDFSEALQVHPYLLRYLPLVQKAPITITYNFDDFIERALFSKKKDSSIGYETVTNPWTQFRRRNAVVYHPHGILPTQLMEFPKDRIVFSESGYAGLFLDALAGDSSFLLNHLSKNTCLIIGSSLEDEDLRNLLVQSNKANPGNPHYFVYFLKDGESMSSSDAEAIRRANFHVYNLITLFLHQNEIAALGDLLHDGYVSDDEFADGLVERDNYAAYRFYLTGALAVGKSTTSSYFRNLLVLDEWTEPRLPLLAKPWDKLTPDERNQVDRWIAKQFRIKNDSLRHEKFGIALVDRPPLDPLGFAEAEERPAKAQLLQESICAGDRFEFADGIVIFLVGDAKELAARVLATGREGYTADRLGRMEQDLRDVYGDRGVRIVETRGRSIAEVVRRVSEIIHFEEYATLFTFRERLRTMTQR